MFSRHCFKLIREHGTKKRFRVDDSRVVLGKNPRFRKKKMEPLTLCHDDFSAWFRSVSLRNLVPRVSLLAFPWRKKLPLDTAVSFVTKPLHD